MFRISAYTVLALLIIFASGSILGRTADASGRAEAPKAAAATPAYCAAEHNVGKIALSVNNNGTFGGGYFMMGDADCFTGEIIRSCEYPKDSFRTYLFSGVLWVGAIIGEDTLVSTGADGWSTSANEFHPDETPMGDMLYRSTIDPSSPNYIDAVSDQDFVSVYADTCTNCPGITWDEVDQRPHRPLGIEVTQKSYAWAYPHAEDFVLFDYLIRNIGSEELRNVHLGFYVDADIHHLSVDGDPGAQDDISGFLSDAENPLSPAGCPDSVSLQLAWAADNDGDLDNAAISVPHVTGILLLDSPSDSLQVSYNWWISNGTPSLDYGPQTRIGYRDFGTGGTGTPVGDRNKYHVLSNGEFDFDQIYVATIGEDDPVWLPPPSGPVLDWCDGLDTRYLLSFGPFDVEPGEELPLVFAFVAGENMHVDPSNSNHLQDDPDAYYEGVDFSDLITNAVWAGWTYDNPGIDTDLDGDAGRAWVCEGDTFWYQGDGVADFRAAAGPEVPQIWVEPTPGGLRVRWNGHASETSVDPFSQEQDFEGYNVYLAEESAPGSYVRLAGYDVEDYYKYFWNAELSDWDIARKRFYADELICAYAAAGCEDDSWHPLNYPRENPYFLPGFPDSVFYYEPILANACQFGLETPIVKIYPDALRPDYSLPSDVPPDSISGYLTDDGFFKFYEYEYRIDGLLPAVAYRVSVTAFDYGSFAIDALPLETAIEPNSLPGIPYPDETNCCVETVGSIALVPDCGVPDQVVDITDIQLLIDHMFLSFTALCCDTEGDTDLSGEVDIVDLQLLIDSQFLSLAPLAACP